MSWFRSHDQVTTALPMGARRRGRRLDPIEPNSATTQRSRVTTSSDDEPPIKIELTGTCQTLFTTATARDLRR